LYRWFFKKLFGPVRGFTLVEMVVVLGILALVTGAVTVSVSNVNSNTRLSNAAYRSLSDLRYAQEMAILNRREVEFIVNVAGNWYKAQYKGGSVLPSPLDPSENLYVVFNQGEYKGVTFTSSGLGGSTLSFDQTGRPLLGGSSLPSDEISVIYFNSKVHLIIVSSGYSYLSETVGGGGCGC